MRAKSSLANQTVRIKTHVSDIGGAEIYIEDWRKNVGGKPWGLCDGNPACLIYAVRSGLSNLPPDNEVLFGKIGGLGYLVHVDELEEVHSTLS